MPRVVETWIDVFAVVATVWLNNQPHRLNYDEALTTLEPHLASQARAFLSAAEDLQRRASGRAGTPTSRGCETALLAEWAGSRGFLIVPTAFEECDLISNSTSEHEVRYHKDQNRAWKRTWAGFYGQVPFPDQGRLGRRNATPSEYMTRMALQIMVFSSDIRLEGVSISDKPSMIIGQPAGEPSFVISQEWLERAQDATPLDIAGMLTEDQFQAVRHSYYGWYRSADGVVIVDAKADNFIATQADIIALDLQMAIFTPEQAAAAGLLSAPNIDSTL